MKTFVLATVFAVMVSPAMASSGRIACQNEVQDVVQWIKGNDLQVSRETADRIEVANRQCRFAPGLAQASLDGLRQQLEMPSIGPQAAYEPPSDEWLDVHD